MTYKEAFEALRAEIFKRMNNLCCNGVVANNDKDKYLLLQDLFGYVVSLPVEDGSPSVGKSAGDVFGKEPLQATLDYLEEAKKHYATPDGLTKCQAWVRGLAKKSEAEASDDLDDAAYYFAMDEYGNPKESGFLFNQRCFKAGADWQKQKDQESIKLVEEPDLDKAAKEHAANLYGEDWMKNERVQDSGFKAISNFKFGAGWQKQQMMKDAVDGVIHKGLYGSKYIKEQDNDMLNKALEKYNPGDKVKAIIIKD